MARDMESGQKGFSPLNNSSGGSLGAWNGRAVLSLITQEESHNLCWTSFTLGSQNSRMAWSFTPIVAFLCYSMLLPHT